MPNKRKTDKCPGCMPNDRGAIHEEICEVVDWEADDLEWRRFWSCLNCGHRQIIKPRRSFTPNTITPRQQRTLDRLRRTLPLYGDVDDGRHEWKSWEVTTTDYGPIWLSCEFGCIGDEGTALSVIGRSNWHICIQTGGAIKSHRAPHWHKRERDRRV